MQLDTTRRSVRVVVRFVDVSFFARRARLRALLPFLPFCFFFFALTVSSEPSKAVSSDPLSVIVRVS